MRGREKIVVKPAGETDWQGDPGPEPSSYELKGCQTWPRASTEQQGGTVIQSGREVFVPANRKRPIEATDTIEWRGDDYEVVGVPGEFLKGGRSRGTLLVIRRQGR